jgi:hypothetical protein
MAQHIRYLEREEFVDFIQRKVLRFEEDQLLGMATVKHCFAPIVFEYLPYTNKIGLRFIGID